MKRIGISFSEFHKKLAKGREFPPIIKVPILTISSWLFQGILYMDRTERVFKILLDILFFVPFYCLILLFNCGIPGILVSFAMAHTLNWVFNSHIFVLMKNLNLKKTEPERFNQYLERLQKRIKSERSIIWAGVFGSLARGEFKETSDLDVRLVRKPGLINGVRACFFAMRERVWATIGKFPLDIYVLDNIGTTNRHIDKNEIGKVIVLYDPCKILKGVI
ncbi:MAG: nucleotidyltransferase domain-containing protein [Methanomassiliicoccales archaeon]|jgi:predicted nucleotidyltransferase|nr:nucleotidyltransferase domain-containing protein [Methanomassiliicoccales archaeon]